MLPLDVKFGCKLQLIKQGDGLGVAVAGKALEVALFFGNVRGGQKDICG